jgi:cytochrome c biogenesis protein CcdA
VTGALVVAAAALVAVLAGGPVTAFLLRVVDRRSHHSRSGHGSIAEAGELLRGGAWIGALERTAVFATLLAGWPEGIAATLALKSFGRYPELKTSRAGTAERFIIGTFVSVLWATACAGVAIWLS